MSEDYYQILNVEKGATDDEIKQAYRKLAKIHHPDKGGDKELFQKIQNAYDTLSDTEKRAQYDSPMSSMFSGGGGFPFNMDVNNMVNSFFGQNIFSQKKQNLYYICKVKLSDVYVGIIKKFSIKRDKFCSHCIIDCSNCNGSGKITQQNHMGPFIQICTMPCNICSGTCKSKQVSCDVCDSKGFITEQKIVEINVYKGMENNTEFTYTGWGTQGSNNNETSGDLIVRIEIEKDEHFERIGLNLIYNTNITLKESLVGKNIIIPHFDGNIKENISIFGIINPNKTYTIPNKGLIKDNQTGDLHIKFEIIYPNKKLSNEDKNIIDKIDF
jgi:DnaJ-class molecular chaperone